MRIDRYTTGTRRGRITRLSSLPSTPGGGWTRPHPRVGLAVSSAGLAALVACMASASASTAQASSTSAPVVDCSRHVEGGQGPLLPARRDLLTARIAFSGLRDAAFAPAGRFRPTRRGRWRIWKAGPIVHQSGPVTLVVRHEDRSDLQLLWQGGSGPTVTFKPCDQDQPAFSYQGRVGPWTGFSGGFRVRRPGCHRLELRQAGARRPLMRTLRFGVQRCA
jgi:hypothetical protein